MSTGRLVAVACSIRCRVDTLPCRDATVSSACPGTHVASSIHRLVVDTLPRRDVASSSACSSANHKLLEVELEDLLDELGADRLLRVDPRRLPPAALLHLRHTGEHALEELA